MRLTRIGSGQTSPEHKIITSPGHIFFCIDVLPTPRKPTGKPMRPTRVRADGKFQRIVSP